MNTLITLTSSDKQRIDELFDEYTKESELISKMVFWTYDPDISTNENHLTFFDFNYSGYFENYFGEFIISINNIAESSGIVILDDKEIEVFNYLIRGNNNDLSKCKSKYRSRYA